MKKILLLLVVGTICFYAAHLVRYKTPQLEIEEEITNLTTYEAKQVGLDYLNYKYYRLVKLERTYQTKGFFIEVISQDTLLNEVKGKVRTD